MTRYKCDICGNETNNTFRTSKDWKWHSICDKCTQMSDEELSNIDIDKRIAVVIAKTLNYEEDN